MSNEHTSLDKLIKAFEVRNRSSNRSPRTVTWYSNNLRLFRQFLEHNGYALELGKVGLQEAREFIIYLQNRKRYEGHPITPAKAEKLSPQTIRAHVETLKSFFTWLHEEGYTEQNKLEKLEPPKVPKKFVEVLSEEEIRRILSALDQGTGLGTRNAAIVMTLLDTGLRCAELANLAIEDSHIEQGYLKVMGKGSKERVVPIGALVQKVLLRYSYHFRPEPVRPDIKNLFLTIEGRPMTVDNVQLMIKRLGKASGVPRLHAHLSRHTFATTYLINGGDVFSLQQILGHTSLEMVRRYVSLSSAQITVQHRKFSPMDRMNLLRLKVSPSKLSKRRNGKRAQKRMLVRDGK